MAHRPHRLLGAGLMLAGVLAASACDPPTALSTNAGAAPAAAGPDASAVTAELNALPVRVHSSLAGYSREAFGPAWSDEGSVELAQNHCPTRQDILSRDLTDVVRAQDGCTVVSGVLHDRYTGETIVFRRGPTTSLAVQIDHIVPLGLAWQSGARDLTAAQRLDFRQCPSNLAAVSGPANAAKGAKDA
uniref:HNH endonuclease family protein n=1 Tax=Streptomyces graminilatus TaxID=1464070 RepID=UPI0006E212B1